MTYLKDLEKEVLPPLIGRPWTQTRVMAFARLVSTGSSYSRSFLRSPLLGSVARSQIVKPNFTRIHKLSMAPVIETVSQTLPFKTYNDEFLNEKGKKIFCYYWEPVEKPRALVLLSHGFTDHSMMYENLAEEMVKRRFFVFAHDHAGHGRSEGPRAHVNSVHHLIDDSIYHIEKLRKKFPELPLFMWGHSMGGAITFLATLRKEVKFNGIISVAPALAANPETATPLKVALAKILCTLIPTFPIAYADVTLSTSNPHQIEKMKNDPLRHRGYFQARSTISLLKAGEEILKKKSTIDTPYLLLHGDNDKVCHIQGSEILHGATASKDKTFIAYRGAYHSLLQEPDEVSSDVLIRCIQWLDERA